ncbi:MAG: DUF5020 family protein [Prevotella sp.]
MKTKIITMLLAILSLTATAQDVQFLYDLGHSLYNDIPNRSSVTTTFEMFKPDKWGSTFTFMDINYQSDGVAGAYMEFAREFNLTANKQWAAHIEYNGGLTSDRETWDATRFQHAVLLGGAWNWHNPNFSKTFSFQAMYKYYFKNKHWGLSGFNGFQVTEVWGINFADNLCTFSGFCDLWYDPTVNGHLILLSQPQFWVNLNQMKGMKDVNLSLGSEVEFSNNFIWNNKGQHNKFYTIPSLAAKWTF